MPFKYQSGEQIQKGDHVLYHRNPAEVEFVACDPPDTETDWYIEQYGGGVMIADPLVSGRTFIPAVHLANYEKIEFVSRDQS